MRTTFKKRSFILVLVVLTAITFLTLKSETQAAAAVTYGSPVNISNNSLTNFHVQINSKGQVSWVSSDWVNYQVNLYDGSTTKQIRSSTNKISTPKINAHGVVAWTEDPPCSGVCPNQQSIWLYNGSYSQLITPQNGSSSPSINDSAQIAYYGVDSQKYISGIFLYSGGSITELTTDFSFDPSINNNTQIVYTDYSAWQIHLISGSNRIISQSGTSNGNAQINDQGHAIWEGAVGWYNNHHIYFYDGTTTRIISNNADNNVLSAWRLGQINAVGQVVWRDLTSGDIYLYSNGTVQNLTQNQSISKTNGHPYINDNGQVVWYGADPVKLGSQLYLYSGGVVKQLVQNAGDVNYIDDYTYCPVINNIGQIAFVGNDSQIYLISPVGPPSVTTGSATNVTQNSATLNGTVDPNGSSTTYYFQWGTTTAYGNATSSQSAGSGSSNVAVSANLTGLTLNTTYHYRMAATNSAGTSYGSDMTFKTTGNALPWLMLLLGN